MFRNRPTSLMTIAPLLLILGLLNPQVDRMGPWTEAAVKLEPSIGSEDLSQAWQGWSSWVVGLSDQAQETRRKLWEGAATLRENLHGARQSLGGSTDRTRQESSAWRSSFVGRA